MIKKKIYVIVGPTASGKSDFAVRMAQKFKGEVGWFQSDCLWRVSK